MSSSLCEGYVSFYKGLKLNEDTLKYSVKFIADDDLSSVIELQNRVLGSENSSDSIYKVINLNFNKHRDNLGKIFGVYVGGKLVACSSACCNEESIQQGDLASIYEGLIHPNFAGNGFEPMLDKIKSDIETVWKIKKESY